MVIQRKIFLYTGKSFGFSPSEKLTVCHFIRCIFTFSQKEIFRKKEKSKGKNEFSGKGADRARKKIGKISAEKENAKNGRKEGRTEETQKKMIFGRNQIMKKKIFRKTGFFCFRNQNFRKGLPDF